MSIGSELYRALRKNEFVLHYQPRISMRSHHIIGMEALIRWNAGGTLFYPDKFIGAAEDTGLIVPISEWVIQEACRQIAEWSHNGAHVPRIGVNLSTKQFGWWLVKVVEDALREQDVKPSSLELEITESILAQDHAEANLIMQELRAMGIELSIDDFGTGYSNLISLKRFPFHTLKIDREFVGAIGDNEQDLAIVQAIMDISKKMGLYTVAEGVETEPCRRLLQTLGCDAWQGYLLSRPMPAADIYGRYLRGEPAPMPNQEIAFQF